MTSAAYNLTAWGYQDCQYDTGDGSYGGMLSKLLFRTLPQYFPRGSAYSHFPFLDPKFMQKHMSEINSTQAAKYTWSRPKPVAPTFPVCDLGSVKRVLTDPLTYKSGYEARKFTVVEPALGRQKVCQLQFYFRIRVDVP